VDPLGPDAFVLGETQVKCNPIYGTLTSGPSPRPNDRTFSLRTDSLKVSASPPGLKDNVRTGDEAGLLDTTTARQEDGVSCSVERCALKHCTALTWRSASTAGLDANGEKQSADFKRARPLEKIVGEWEFLGADLDARGDEASSLRRETSAVRSRTSAFNISTCTGDSPWLLLLPLSDIFCSVAVSSLVLSTAVSSSAAFNWLFYDRGCGVESERGRCRQ